jgi:hypothetical protein
MSERRGHVPFDPFYFEREAEEGRSRSIPETFRHIYRTNHWSGHDSISGEGSGREQTQRIEAAIPALVAEVDARTLLDVPCGDFGWMQYVDLGECRYVGGDIVPELILRNRERYGSEDRTFRVLNLTSDPLPHADLILCRDCLVHLSYADISRALKNISASGAGYLLTTIFPECPANEDITTGDWRILNLEAAPFNFPPPLRLINEGCTEGGGRFRDKSLGLWRVEDISTMHAR